MGIDIADIFAQQMRNEEKSADKVSADDTSKQLKDSLKGMDAYLKGKNPDYAKIKINMYGRKP